MDAERAIVIALIGVGLVGLVFASQLAIVGTRSLAARFGRSPLTIGLTIAAVGTSLPEMATNVAAALTHAPGHGSGIAVGNIVGSCLSQITLLLGITAIIRPLRVSWGELRRDGAAALAALMLMALAVSDGTTRQWEGVALIIVYLAYLGYAWQSGISIVTAEAEEVPETPRTLIPLAQAIGGMCVLVLSADLLVDNSVRLAIELGINEDKIGVGVGVATGLPELAFGVQGLRQGAPKLAVGNLIGSNITDPLASFGLGASIRDVQVPPEVLRVDMPLWGVATIAALYSLSRPKGLTRFGGILLVLTFIAYAVVRGLL